MSCKLQNIPIVVRITFLFARLTANNCSECVGHGVVGIVLHYSLWDAYLLVTWRCKYYSIHDVLPDTALFCGDARSQNQNFWCIVVSTQYGRPFDVLVGKTQKERFHACPSQQRIFAHNRSSIWSSVTMARRNVGLYLQLFAVPNSNNNATTKVNAGDTFIANFVRNFLEEFLRHYTERCKSFVCHLDYIILHHVHIRKTNAQTLNTQLELPTQGKQCAWNALDEQMKQWRRSEGGHRHRRQTKLLRAQWTNWYEKLKRGQRETKMSLENSAKTTPTGR